MKVGRIVARGTATLVCASLMLVAARAYAYAVGAGQSSIPDVQNVNQSLNSLAAPFQSFFESLGSMWNSSGFGNVPYAPSVPAPTSWSSQLFTTGAQNAAQSFDGWLYGMFGFHISSFFVAILSVFAWILGAAQGAVNWLIGVFK
jgi:hypothetical protein